MPLYFMLLDADRFHRQMVPALAASWRQRSFEPCRELGVSLSLAVEAFRAAYFAGEEPLVGRLAQGLRFDKHYWRLLVGEILLIAAAEVPDIQTVPRTMCCLLALDRLGQDARQRERFAPIEQAHFGSRDLQFGAAVYRPEYAGINDRTDVVRLAQYLGDVNPDRWRVEDLAALSEVPEEERVEELEFAREWFPALRDLYRRAVERGQVVVCETI
jgi:hypothetical protein